MGDFWLNYEYFNGTEWVDFVYGGEWREKEKLEDVRETRLQKYVRTEPKNVAHKYEIQAEFFKRNNIRPQWHWAKYEWGTLNEATGQWDGGVGLIQRDEVDYALMKDEFKPSKTNSKVVTYSSVVGYGHSYLWTRTLQELHPRWNLIGLFTKGYKSQS